MNKKNKRLISELIVVFLIMIIGNIANYYVEALIGKVLSPEIYGDYRVAITTFSFLGQVLLFGLDYIAIKYISEFIKKREKGRAKYFLIYVIKILIAVSFIWGFFSLMINPFVHKLAMDNVFSKYIHPVYFYLGLSISPLLFFMVVRIVNGLKYNILSELLYNASTLILLLFVILCKRASFETYILSNVLSNVIPIIICGGIIFFYFKRINLHSFAIPKEIIHDAVHYTFQRLWSFPTASILLILIEVLDNSEANVGIFSAVFIVAGILNISINVLRNIFQKRLLDVIHGKKNKIKKLMLHIYVTSIVIAAMIFIIVYCFRHEILDVYGKSFSMGYNLIPYALMCYIPSVITFGDVIFLNYFSSQTNKIMTYLTVAKKVAVSCLGGILIKLFGLDGAISAFLGTEILFAGLFFLIRQQVISDVEN